MDFAKARRAMIDSQLRTSGVNDPRVLAVMSRIGREDLVPEARASQAYADRAVPLDAGRSGGRALPAPVFHGRMLQEADIREGESVLVVDSGAGYLPILVEALGGEVTVVAPDTAMKRGKGSFDVILVDGAAERFPAALAKRAAPGGRIFTGTVIRGVTRLAAGRVVDGEVALLPLAEMGVPVMAEFAVAEEWSF